ncbi:MAG TPA: hypothetical protein DCX95_01150 [Elusimicrobia bacterium]|nr:hypothetical protein [Elusimicrobiota bacterium]
MGFKKGNDPTRNLKGRPAGSANKTTEELRILIQLFIEKNWSRIQEDFDAMKPGERLNFLNSLLRHVLPEPLSFERLSETQLQQLHEYLLRKYPDA